MNYLHIGSGVAKNLFQLQKLFLNPLHAVANQAVRTRPWF